MVQVGTASLLWVVCATHCPATQAAVEQVDKRDCSPLMKFLEPSIIGLANLECRWLKPSRIGDTIHAVVEIAEKIEGRKPDRGTMLMKRLAVNQHGETVMESAWKIVVRRRPS